MSILNILNELASDNSRTFKESVLKRERNNDVLKKVFVAALNPYINYYIKKINYTPNHIGSVSLEKALLELNKLSSREVTGNAAREFLNGVLDACTEDDAEVIRRIIERDLKCGINISTVNKIWPGLIPTFAMMLADTDRSKIKFPAYAQIKMDGVRCHLYFDGEHAHAYSRNGKLIDHRGKLDASAKAMMLRGETWDGELVCINADLTYMPRQISNGIINKAIKGTITEKEAETIVFTTWDIVDFSSTIPYERRFERLGNIFSLNGIFAPKFRLIDYRLVSSMEQAEEFFAEALAAGEEGIILKNRYAVWQPKRVKDLCKFKAENEADLRVIGWEYGTGKNSNRLGNLILGTDDGLLEVSVGTGFSDEQRDEFTREYMLGKIVTVKYNTKIRDETGGWSLFLPRFVEIRFDKDEANTLNEIA
jgi:ATP-dependent DNA ligase